MPQRGAAQQSAVLSRGTRLDPASPTPRGAHQGSHHTVLSTADRSRRSQAGRSAAGSRERRSSPQCSTTSAGMPTAARFECVHAAQLRFVTRLPIARAGSEWSSWRQCTAVGTGGAAETKQQSSCDRMR